MAAQAWPWSSRTFTVIEKPRHRTQVPRGAGWQSVEACKAVSWAPDLDSVAVTEGFLQEVTFIEIEKETHWRSPREEKWGWGIRRSRQECSC